MLELNDVHTYYGSSHVLHGVTLRVEEGQVTTLLGRNGMGKTTTLRTILGLTPAREGTIRFRGQSIMGSRPHRIARMGIGYVPEEREIFPNLNVVENLVMAARPKGSWNLARVFTLFPRLAERRRHWGSQLSGGEAQMLAIGRALMTQPRLLLMDEATEGLSPLLRKEIWQVIGEIRAEGISILLVDKNIKALIELADRHYIMTKGRTTFEGSSADLSDNLEKLKQTLAV